MRKLPKRVFNAARFKVRAGVYSLVRPRSTFVRQVEFRGIKLVVLANEEPGWCLIRDGKYEEPEVDCLEGLIRPSDVCVDIGANIGIYTVFMATKARDGLVLAFEPVPLSRAVLALNVALNSLENVRIYDCVVSDTAGEVEFSVSEDTAYSSMRSTSRSREAARLKVPANTLDCLFAQGKQRVDVLKIDVEGAEFLVLKGGEMLLSDARNRPRAVLVELNAKNQALYNCEPREIVEYMRALGYDAYSITASGAEKRWPVERAAEDVLFLDAKKYSQYGTSNNEEVNLVEDK